MNGATQSVQRLIDDGLEPWRALEYRGQLRNNALTLLGQANPVLKSGLNGSGQLRLDIHHYTDPGARRCRLSDAPEQGSVMASCRVGFSSSTR